MSEKTLPNNLNAEQSVLGAALQNAYAADEATETLNQDDFYDKFHSVIFYAITELAKAKKAVDIVTVTEELRRSGSLEAVGGASYLMELVSMVPAPTSVKYYADIVREYSTRRRLIEASEKIERRSSSGEEVSDVLEYAESEILKIGQDNQRQDFVPLTKILEENSKRMQELSELGYGELIGLSTGFAELDKMTLGLQASDLIVLAARPGEGKTSLALNIALNAAMKKNAVVMIFSLEMDSRSLVQRLLSSYAEIDLKMIRSGQVLKNKALATKLGEAEKEIARAKIFIDDTSAIKINEIKNKCRRKKAGGRLDLVIVDYLQLMDFGGDGKTSSKIENRQQEVATLTRMLKQLAREMECPVLVLSQVTREGGKRAKPALTDLRESGAIEQDADIVMFIYQAPDTDDGAAPDPNLTRVLAIEKHRNGETGNITLRWLGQYTKFANYDRNADWMVSAGMPRPYAGAPQSRIADIEETEDIEEEIDGISEINEINEINEIGELDEIGEIGEIEEIEEI